jgi:hypothetical protein
MHVDFKTVGSDEGGEQPLAGLAIQVPQTHGLFDRQSHARHLAVFAACSRQQGVFLAGPGEHYSARFVRSTGYDFSTRRAHNHYLVTLRASPSTPMAMAFLFSAF